MTASDKPTSENISCVSLGSAEVDGDYRYTLTREWSTLPRVLFVMLNPSTADASQDDPTIRKCVGFAKRWGYGSLEVVNLYALRATDPRELWRATGARRSVPWNQAAITAAAQRASLIVVAWGAHSREDAWERHVCEGLLSGKELWCLGLTKAGKPRHPLMVAYQTAFVPFGAK